MIHDKSCGAVVYRIHDGQLFFLIEHMIRGHFSIPKGHPEGTETEEETAQREIREETNLEVRLDPGFRDEACYTHHEGVLKHVVCFAAEAVPGEQRMQESEVTELAWLPREQAVRAVTDDSVRDVLVRASAYLQRKHAGELLNTPDGKGYGEDHIMHAGIQISSFKPLMKTEAEMRQTFLQSAALGCRFVQLQWIDPSVPAESIAAALTEAGLVSVSVQDFFDSVCADEEYYLRLNELTGGEWLCVSRIPERMRSPEGLNRYIQELQRLRKTAEARGQKLCFHPVSADYAGIGGLCPVEEILARMPEMKLCLDLYHLHKAGYSLPAWIAAHAGRIEMVHFKDEKNGALVPAGQGEVAYDGAVEACLKAQVSYGFVEQESWDRDPFVCIGEALAWLRRKILY